MERGVSGKLTAAAAVVAGSIAFRLLVGALDCAVVAAAWLLGLL